MKSILPKKMFCLAIVLTMVTSCGKSKSTPTSTSLPTITPVAVLAESENLQFTDCPFEVPPSFSADAMDPIQCANFTVLEDRQQPEGPKITLAVAIVKSPSTTPKSDPILLLIGNPGEGIDYAYYVQYLFANIFAERDVIIIDQRGTGFSQPSFDCPEFDAVSYETETQNLSIQQSNSKYVEASRTCVNRVKASAANLQDYTTAATAADLEELRLALGYTQWNLYSFYDGSQLALTMMREYPGSIRSVIMDSAIPLQANPQAEWGDHVELAFNRLFETCAENEQCNEAFPKLKSSFYALLDKLDTQPISVDVADLNSGVQYTVMLDSDRLIAFIMNLLPDIDGTAIPEIPRMIYQLQDGKTEAVARLWGSHPLWSDGNSAMAQWLYCSEETYFTTPEQVDKANENLNHHLREYANNSWEGTFQACEEWGGWGVPDIENQSVTSDIPTLLLTGELNWYASTAYIELISQTLNNSTQVVFPGVGQIISITYAGAWAECSKKIVDSFLETPGAGQDTSCASKPAKLLWVTFP